MIDLATIAKSFEKSLTPADVEAIYKAMLSGQDDESWVRERIREVAHKVEDFSERRYPTHLTDEVEWFMTVVEALLAGDGQSVQFLSYGIYSRDDVMWFVEERAESDDKDDREEWEEDPEGYRKYHHRDRTGHSWGDLLPILRLWAQATHYEVWAIYDAVRDAAQSSMLENLASMVSEDAGGREVGKSAAHEFERQMKALYERLGVGIKAS
jgi:hypothetical protein